MKSKFGLMIFILVAWSTAWADGPSQDIKISVKFDHSFYKMEYDNGLFVYQEGPLAYRAKLANCNRSKITKFADQYLKFRSAYSNSSDHIKSKFDVEVTDANGKSVDVARGSEFGTWLRGLPKEMMYFNAEVKAACRL